MSLSLVYKVKTKSVATRQVLGLLFDTNTHSQVCVVSDTGKVTACGVVRALSVTSTVGSGQKSSQCEGEQVLQVPKVTFSLKRKDITTASEKAFYGVVSWETGECL